MAKDKDGFCNRIYEVISGLCVECIVAVLVVVDFLAITAELLIKLDILQDPKNGSTSQESSTQVSNQQNSTLSNSTKNGRVIDPGGTCKHCYTMEAPLEITYCVAHYASVFIAGIFFVEVFLRIVSGRSKVCKDFIQICDSLVVLVMAAMEVLFTVFWDDVLCYDPAVEAATYVVLLRLCRIPRACTVSKREYSEKVDIEMHYLMKSKKKAEDKGIELREKINKQQREIELLQKQLKESKDKGSISTAERGSSEYCNGHISNGTDKSSTDLSTDLYSKPEKTPKRESLRKRRNSNKSGSEPNNTEQKSGKNITIIQTSYQNVEMKHSGESATKDRNEVQESPSGESDVIDSIGDRAGPKNSEDNNGLCAAISYDNSHSAYPPDDFQKKKKVHRSRSDSALSAESASKIAIRQLDVAIDRGGNPRDSGGIDNKSFESDEDTVQMRNLQVMGEYEGTRTYRSAEGVPLTDL